MDCSYSFGFKSVRNVIEMALKLLFLPKNYKNHSAAGGSLPHAPSVICLSCISLFSTGPKLDSFSMGRQMYCKVIKMRVFTLFWVPNCIFS